MINITLLKFFITIHIDSYDIKSLWSKFIDSNLPSIWNSGRKCQPKEGATSKQKQGTPF